MVYGICMIFASYNKRKILFIQKNYFMKKCFLFAAMAALFISCNHKKEEPKLKVSNLVFANYDWSLWNQGHVSTQFSFKLREYGNIQPNGVIKVVEREYDSFQYHEDTLPDSLINKLNQLLVNRKLRKWSRYVLEYEPAIDDGGTYYLSFVQDSIKQEASFGYAYGRKYEPLDSVRACIEDFINGNTLHKTKPFSTDSIFNYLKSYSLQYDPPLPSPPIRVPPKIDIKQFTVPKSTKKHKN